MAFTPPQYPFKVEKWFDGGTRLEHAAVKLYPDKRITLRNVTRVIEEHKGDL